MRYQVGLGVSTHSKSSSAQVHLYICPKMEFNPPSTPSLTTRHMRVTKNYSLQVFVILCHFYCGSFIALH